MGYEHERWIKHLIELRLITEGYNPNEETKAVEELEETYAKAKAFDEIKKLEKETSLYSTAGKEDVELGTEARKIINKYMEDK